MNIDQAIYTALYPIVGDNIWNLSKPATEDPDQFVVYNPENEYLDYGDNQDTDAEMSIQVHWYAKGHADYVGVRSQVRSALKNAGFLLEPSPYAGYESDDGTNAGAKGTGWTHFIIVCRAEVE